MGKQPVQLPLFQEETVSVQWTAKQLGVSDMTVLRYREEGLLQGYQMKDRGWWRIIRSSVVEYEQKLRAQREGRR
jgi:predicted site-specific integrase-resolvase